VIEPIHQPFDSRKTLAQGELTTHQPAIHMIGQIISHYKILEKLGEGGMGVVYKAIDLRLQRKVALKMLPASLARLSKSDRDRFLLEAQATSSLDHPNICTVYEVDETPEGHVFIAMALYEGETLAQRIKRGALVHEEIVKIASQVGLGLQAAHEQGLVHEECINKSLAYNPFFPFAHHQLSQLYRRMNKPEKAVEHFRKLKEIWKDLDPAWKTIYFSEQSKK
jgi:hypothetical protein